VPKWFLAQPMRMLAHNGEINTLLGNINWMKSRQNTEQWSLYGSHDTKEVRGPLVDVGRSDSANLDSTLDSYTKAGKTVQEALMILVPEAYESQPKLKVSLFTCILSPLCLWLVCIFV
jgi:glutamate synthase (ferredoxin)